MLSKLIFKKHVRNCLICAIRPLIYAGITITYIGAPKCPHFNNVHKPRIEKNTLSTYFARICNLLFVTAVLFFVFKISRSERLAISPKYYYQIILPNYVNTLNYTFCFLMNNSSYIKRTNCLITLIDKRKYFGIDSILSKKLTKRLQIWSLSWLYLILVVCVLFLITTTPRELSTESVLLAVSMAINSINALAFGSYGVTTLMVYNSVFNACFESILETFRERHGKQILVATSLRKKLQYQQQFYLAACSNYREHVFGFGNVFFYTGQLVFTVFSVVQAYFYYFEPADVDGFWLLTYSKFFQIFLGVASSVICIQSNSIYVKSQDLISFLYKYKISQLSSEEALQVEMLLITLQTERPVLTASNLYTIGLNIMASVSATAVTYILVALQFHTSFSTA